MQIFTAVLTKTSGGSQEFASYASRQQAEEGVANMFLQKYKYDVALEMQTVFEYLQGNKQFLLIINLVNHLALTANVGVSTGVTLKIIVSEFHGHVFE